MRRTALLAAVVSASALLLPATQASAVPTCNTTTGGPFNGTTVCYETFGVRPVPFLSVPYSVGAICVGGVCTPPVAGTIDVPLVNDPADVYGTLCVTVSRTTVCRAFQDDFVIGSLD